MIAEANQHAVAACGRLSAPSGRLRAKDSRGSMRLCLHRGLLSVRSQGLLPGTATGQQDQQLDSTTQANSDRRLGRARSNNHSMDGQVRRGYIHSPAGPTNHPGGLTDHLPSPFPAAGWYHRLAAVALTSRLAWGGRGRILPADERILLVYCDSSRGDLLLQCLDDRRRMYGLYRLPPVGAATFTTQRTLAVSPQGLCHAPPPAARSDVVRFAACPAACCCGSTGRHRC